MFINEEITFWLANRGHHADIGGILPGVYFFILGSMPPSSKFLNEEGAAIHSVKLVKKGKFQTSKIVEILSQTRGDIPGTRLLEYFLV